VNINLFRAMRKHKPLVVLFGLFGLFGGIIIIIIVGMTVSIPFCNCPTHKQFKKYAFGITNQEEITTTGILPDNIWDPGRPTKPVYKKIIEIPIGASKRVKILQTRHGLSTTVRYMGIDKNKEKFTLKTTDHKRFSVSYPIRSATHVYTIGYWGHNMRFNVLEVDEMSIKIGVLK